MGQGAGCRAVEQGKVGGSGAALEQGQLDSRLLWGRRGPGWWGWDDCGAGLGDPPGCSALGRSSVAFPPGRAEFRAEVLQKKREALASGEDSAELMEEHRRLMAWNDEENARQRARRSA